MSVETQNLIIGILLGFGVPMAAATLVTALICRYRIARKKRISAGTVLVGAVSLPVIFAIGGTLLDADFWSTRNKGPGVVGVLIILGLVTIISFLPAGAVVRYYQKRSKKNETPVV
jgi:MFS family permease